MEVILTKEAEKNFRNFLYEVAMDEISKVKNDLGIDRLLNQTEIAEFLNVSTTTIRKWETEGMPYGSMGAQSKFYDKFECKKWVLGQNR